MSGPRPAEIIRHLEHAAPAEPDGELLAAFVRRRDQAAFAALVRRHGPMVLAVCRRVTNHPQDAEDAFQAAFLVLARRAAAVHTPGLLGNWLYGVAVRVAQKARRSAARRRAREVQAVDVPEPAVPPDDPPAEIGPVLHEELAKLAACYREAIVLCDLRGVSRAGAAKALGIPEGTLSSRLAGGRKKLAERLARRGVALSAAAVPLALADGRAAAGVPDSLVSKTCGLVAGWAAGATVPGPVARLARGDFSMRKTLLLGLLATTLVGAGAVLAARPTDAPTADDPPRPPTPPVAKVEPKAAVPAADPKPGDKADGFTTKPALRRVIDLPVKDTFTPVWSPDGNRLAVAGVGADSKQLVACVLDLAADKITPRQTIVLPPAGSLVGFTRDGKGVVTDLHEDGLVSGFHRLEFWPLAGVGGPMGGPGVPGLGEPVGPVQSFAPARTVDLDPETTTGYSFAPDGKTYRTVVTETRDYRFTKLVVREVSTETGKTLKTVAQLDGEYAAFQLSRDGKRLAASGKDALELHTLDSGRKVVVPHGELDPLYNSPNIFLQTTVALSPTGAVAFVHRGIGRPVLVNGVTGEVLPPPEGLDHVVAHAGPGSFSADGRLVAMIVIPYVRKEVGGDRDVEDLPGRKGARPPRQAAISAADPILQVWDTRTGKRVKAWPARRADLAFHPARPVLAVAEPNGNSKTRLGLWDFSAEAKGK